MKKTTSQIKIPKSVTKLYATKQATIALLAASAVLVGGMVWVVYSLSLKADTSTTASYQAEAGSRSGNASVVSDGSASGGSAVKFGQASNGSCPNASHTPGGSDGMGGCWPYAGNTGVPAGTTLTNFNDSGVCHLSTANATYDAKIFNCDVVIEASGIKITRSRINGPIFARPSSGTSITISDSRIDGGQQETFPAVAYNNITLTRVEVVGGQHSVQCSLNCTITDSFLHDQFLPPDSGGHVNAFISNGGSGFTLTHNTLWCSVTSTPIAGGCTADASLFGDFGPISDAHLDKNLFIARNDGAGYCIQAGYHSVNPVPSNVRVTNNIFQRGPNGRCGMYGVATAFYNGNGGVWSGNAYDNGVSVPAP